MFLIASLLLTMFVCVNPTTVYAETAETEPNQSSSESLGDTLQEDMGWAESEFFDGPLGKIIVGLFFIFAGIINAIRAVFTTIFAFIAGIGTSLWGIVEFFVGLFQ